MNEICRYGFCVILHFNFFSSTSLSSEKLKEQQFLFSFFLVMLYRYLSKVTKKIFYGLYFESTLCCDLQKQMMFYAKHKSYNNNKKIVFYIVLPLFFLILIRDSSHSHCNTFFYFMQQRVKKEKNLTEKISCHLICFFDQTETFNNNKINIKIIKLFSYK